ncbi:MAG: DUF4292 domain-containing protein [Bacteroidales bacterium]|nr:DUF4292 domain-containing protein [Bacteroidales bacterium]
MKTLLRILPIFALLLTLGSCATWRSGDAYRPNEPLAITGKISASFDSDSKDRSFSGTLRMRRDQVIQLSLTKFGIEGVRIIFTPDSVLVLDRLHKRYLHSSYEHLPSLGMPQALSFKTIQGFLWNDDNRQLYELSTTFLHLFVVEMRIERSKHKRIRGHKIPQNNHFDVNLLDKDYALNLNLSNLKINYGWSPNTRVPSGYEPIDVTALLKSLR